MRGTQQLVLLNLFIIRPVSSDQTDFIRDSNARSKGNQFYTYTLLDGLAYNTRGYFASCVVFFRAPQGRGKMRAMSKMSASIIC